MEHLPLGGRFQMQIVVRCSELEFGGALEIALQSLPDAGHLSGSGSWGSLIGIFRGVEVCIKIRPVSIVVAWFVTNLLCHVYHLTSAGNLGRMKTNTNDRS